jgi:3'(2'), 5'-bisphosphate nucleotidase
MITEEEADLYPRFGLTMEWDTGAGQAIVLGAKKCVTLHDTKTILVYNKEDLLNSYFIVR